MAGKSCKQVVNKTIIIYPKDKLEFIDIELKKKKWYNVLVFIKRKGEGGSYQIR